jgi:nitrogen fixation/metabolism regulation signal transduction histidine kinase
VGDGKTVFVTVLPTSENLLLISATVVFIMFFTDSVTTEYTDVPEVLVLVLYCVEVVLGLVVLTVVGTEVVVRYLSYLFRAISTTSAD